MQPGRSALKSRKRVMNKSGVSAVVATVLIIMITVAAVGVVWAVVIPMIKDSLGGSAVCNDVDVSIGTTQGYTCYDSVQKVVAVQVVKGANNLVVSGLKFTVSSGGNSVSYSTDFSFVKSASKVFYINVSKLNSVEEIGLIPVLVDGKSSKECTKVGLNIIPSCSLGEVKEEILVEDGVCKEDCSCAENTLIGESCDNKCEGLCAGEKIRDGTTLAPFAIYNWADLNNTRNNLQASYVLMNDLGSDADYAGIGDSWQPIGDCGDDNQCATGDDRPFTGSFNGNGYTLTGLTINLLSTDGVGLFGFSIGDISNISLTNTNIQGKDFVGGLVGWNEYSGGAHSYIASAYSSGTVTGNDFVGGLVGNNWGVISNTSYSSGTVTGNMNVGGLVGQDRGTISNSYSSGTVTGNIVVGGLAGDNSGSITESYSMGSISGDSQVGGLVGINGGSITNSYATGEVTGNAEVGGLIGGGSGSITNSYATGPVTGEGQDPVGGLIGACSGSITNSYATGSVSASGNAGGLVGYLESSGSITNSYATGSVSASGNAGGLVGINSGSITNSFWDKKTSGQTVMCGSTSGSGCDDSFGKTTAQMQKLFTFNSNWDISGGQTDLNNGYPYLSGTSSPVWYIADNTDVALADGASCTSSEECLSGVCGAKNYLVDFLHSPGNICRPTGDLPIGSSCSADNGWDGRNCESGYCDQGNACSTGEIGTSCYVGYRSCVSGFCVNGVCSATPGQIGQGCGQERGDCESTYCSGSVCTDGGIGAECYSIDSCQSGYYCSNGGNGASGICTDGSTGSPCNDMGYDPMCLSGSCVNNICE